MLIIIIPAMELEKALIIELDALNNIFPIYYALFGFLSIFHPLDN
jgi:hypothetical protein